MLSIWMILFFAASDSQPVREIDSLNAVATTLCARQTVRIAEPSHTSAAALACPSNPKLVNEWLAKWETASKRSKERTRSEKEDFRRRVQAAFNEHAVAAGEQLIGSVTAKSLNNDFFWRITKNTPYEVCLEAIPKDEMEQLFYGSMRVTLSQPGGTPQQLLITNRNQQSQIVWRSDPAPKRSQVQLIRFENEIPPSPSRLRVADRRSE